MGIKQWFGYGEEKRTQSYFHDDGSFEFRKLPFDSTCLVKKVDGVVSQAWKHFFSAEVPFDGYKNIPGDMVTVSYGRDFILDLFNKVPVADNPQGGKPIKNEVSIKKWTAQVAESQRYKVNCKPGTTVMMDKLIGSLGIGLGIMVLGYVVLRLVG